MARPVPFVPPPGKVLLIAGQDKANIQGYLDAVGAAPGGFTIYTSVQDVDGLAEPVDHGAGIHHAQHWADRYPHAVIHLGLWMVGAEADTAEGRYDAHVDRLIDWIAAVRRPVFLRIGYEFDLPENHYEPAAYVKAWRRIVDRFRARGVDNAAFVWHSYAAGKARPITDWYPGDDYVDWISVSFFGQTMEILEEVAEFAAAKGKPFMVGEAAPACTGTREGAASWAKWFDRFFDYVRRRNVRVICYINCDWDAISQFVDLKWGDCRLQAHPEVLARWKAETAKPAYLQASPDLFARLGHRPSSK